MHIKLLSFNPITDDNSFMIQAFGLDTSGKTYSLKIKNMKPFFYVKIGDDWDEDDYSGFIEDVINTMVERKMEKYNIPQEKEEQELEKMDDYFDINVDYEVVDRRKLYGFDNKKQYQFMKFEFKTMSAFYQMKNLWYYYGRNNEKKQIKYKYNSVDTEIYEANIPTLLRFFHIRNISPCGWIRIERKHLKKNIVKETTCQTEGIIDMKNIHPEPTMEDKVPYKICSFDIEANSSHGDFPRAKKDYLKTVNEIIDIWNAEEYSDYPFDEQELFLKTLLMDAFNGGGTTDMSYVYLKHKCHDIENRIKYALRSTIADVELGSIYDNRKLTEYYREIEGEEHTSEYDKKKTNIAAYIKKGTNIFDILNNKELSKDDKSACLVTLFNKYFPEIKGDIVTFIGSTFWRYGEPEQYLNHCIVLGDSTPITNAELECVKTEKALLLEWTKIILREDPDIIIGYNIFGFDYSFMIQRAEELNCLSAFMKMSRNKSHVCEVKETTLQIASGTHTLQYIDMPGRDSIDLYNYFRREFNLESYKLDYVGGNFIGDSIKDYTNNDEEGTTTFKSKNLSGLQLENFINFQEIGHSVDYYEEGKKYKVIGIDKEKNQITVTGLVKLNKEKMLKWCLAKDDVSPQDIFKLSSTGIASDKAIIAKYCIQDCNLVHYLFNKIDILTGLIEMANICTVPLSFLVMRGQGIKLLSFLSKRCREMGVLMPDLDKTRGNEGFEGAIVLSPKCDLYLKEPVACVDYSSLYPSSIISENLSHDSKVWTREYDLAGNLKKETGSHEYDNLPDFKYVDITFDTFRYLKNKNGKDVKTKVGYKTCRFAQFPNEELAIIPSILKELLAARKATRKRIKYKTVTTTNGKTIEGLLKQTDTHHIITNKEGEHKIPHEAVSNVEDTYTDFMKNILDKRQLAYKVTANSTYGQTGAKTSSFYEQDVAAATTKTGQKLLIYARNVIEGIYGDKICETKYGKVHSHAEYIYGDTDSVFMSFKLTTLEGEPIVGKEALKHTIELAKEAGELATKFLKAPHDLEYEKTFMPFCLLSKKRYVGMLYEEDPDKCKRKSMGIVLKRRDNAPIVKDVYGGIIDILMKDQDINKSIDFLMHSLNDIVEGRYSEKKFIITKSLRSNYKNPNQIAHKVLANRMGQRDAGNKPKSGDRIAYMYFVQKRKPKLQGDKIETPEFIRANNLEIDYEFYITNQIMKPVLQIFALVLEQIPSYRRQIRNFKMKLNTLTQTCEDQETLMKKEIELRNKEVTKLIFGPILTTIKNKKMGVKQLGKYFKTKN